MPDTPAQRKLRSDSHSNSTTTLKDIKTLIESTKTEILTYMKKEVDGIKGILQCLVNRVDEIECVNRKLEERCAKLEEKQDNIISEIEDRQRRQLNLVISGLPEQRDGNSDERRAHDESEVKLVLNEMGIKNVKSYPVSRIGKTRSDRPRLLKVTCPDVTSKQLILRSGKVLRSSTLYRNVYVNEDRTPLQQEHSKQLRAELKRRKECGEDVVIFRNKISLRNDLKNFRKLF